MEIIKQIRKMEKQLHGVHTPEETTSLINRLKLIGFDVEDWSWGNDEADSIRFKREATLWLPNNEFKHFSYLPWKTTWIDDNGQKMVDEHDWDNQILFNTLDELLDHIMPRQRRENIEYLMNDYGLRELWNDDEFKNIPNLTDDELQELVNERKDFYNEG